MMKVVPRILATITIVFNILCFSHAVAEAQRTPNILVIVTDEAVVGAESLLIEWAVVKTKGT